MAKNKLTDLRDHLFEMLETLKDASKDDLHNEVQRAQAIVGVSQAIIDSAKVEVSYARSVEAMPNPEFFEGNKFLDDPRMNQRRPPRLNGEGRA